MSTIAPGTFRAAPAPVSGWRRMFGDSLLVSGSAAICQALGVATSLLLRLALDPAQMGVWQALRLFLNYANYANLGISKGAARELSIALGRGETAEAERGLNLAFTVNTLSSFVYAAVLAGAGVWLGLASGGLWNNAWAVGLLALSVLVVLQRHVTFRVTILRCRQTFGVAAQLSVVEGILALVVGASAAWCWGLNGLYAGTLAVLGGALAFLHWRGAEGFAWAWDRREIARLIGIGGPILLAGAVSTLFQSLDKLMILAYSPDREFELGCYSLSLLVSGQIFGLANMLSLVMAPRYGELFGRVGRRREVAMLAARASELLAAALALLAGVAIVAAGPVLERMLPDYRPGLAPALWLVPGAVALGLSLPANQYLVAVGLQRRALAALLAATALAAAGNHLALTLGYGLVGVAISTSFSYAASYLVMVAISIWPELDRAARGRYVMVTLFTLVPSLTTATLLEIAWPSILCGLAAASLKMSLVFVVWAATALVGWLWGGWHTVCRAEAAPFILHAADNETCCQQKVVAGGRALAMPRQDSDRGIAKALPQPPRPSLAELERRCQKPDHRRIGNWMARRVSRPLALRITWLVLPWGVSAHAVTLVAWLCAVVAAAVFAVGTVYAWLTAAALLQLWYLLDHVDGQLARWRGTASLDGVQLDYLMHHTVNLVLPLGVGYGLAAAPLEPLWLALGLAWGLGLLVIGLVNDTRYKAFIERLKTVEGPLVVGRGCRPEAAAPRGAWRGAPWRMAPLGMAWWLARKACEIHVVMMVLTCVALVQWLLGDASLSGGRMLLAGMAFLAPATAAAVIVRSTRRETAEREFAAWYRVPDGCELVFDAGTWKVIPTTETNLHGEPSHELAQTAGHRV
ncbi:MAG TPA: oligosaccharide flippase family protein [Pirellulales bacterium]|nr:oligosaccharide flippase family protein [Pirellulales bacterium]